MSGDFVSKARELLKDIAQPLKKAKERRRNEAFDFNVFDAAGISRRELRHSAFLSALLDPSGAHGQGALFLRNFLDCLKIEVPEIALQRATVRTEYPIDDGRRLDVLVEIPGEALIAIENKIDAGEQQDQISHYRRWLDKERRQSRNSLVFLTPDRRLPISGECELLSYADLAECLKRSIDACNAPRLRLVVEQYAELCAVLGGSVIDMFDDEVMEILDRPEQAEMALELGRYITALRRRVVERFWENVRHELDRKLIEGRLDSSWDTATEVEAKEYYKPLIIRPKRSVPNTMYCVGAHVWSQGSFLAVQRPRGRACPNETTLLNILRRCQYTKADSNFPGWRYTREMGLPDFGLEETAVLQLRDNAATAHREAKLVASEIFALFVACHEELERLNSEMA